MGEQQYEIALSPKIYSMMSDKLYTDRIGSVVREVCSNAWDAQKMKSLATGEPMEPFKVTLPTEFEPHFVVEDTGPGMPDEVAQRLYRTLGLSTKENTNDQIGAFGLGSKSPFAVTDTFTVENTYEGITHFYLCFKAENGLPSLLNTGSRAEGRKDGVKVIIPAPGHRYAEYKKALHRQLIVMEPKPIIGNIEQFDFAPAEKVAQTSYGFVLANATDYNLNTRAVYARMGMVLYPVDFSQLGYSYYDAKIHENMKSNSALVLEFDIGDLEPLPSREGLTYDDKTRKAIKAKYEEFARDYRKELIKTVISQPTALDGWLKMQEIRNSMNIDLEKDDLYVLGFPLKNYYIQNAFPYFDHEYERLVPYTSPKANVFEQAVDDYDGEFEDEEEVDPPEVVLVEGKKFIPKKEVDNQCQFVFELFDGSDLRLNKTRKREGFTANFRWLSEVVNKKHKFLLMDEAEPKHRIGRMKSVLNSIQGRRWGGDDYFVVYVNPNYEGDKLDFSEFLACLDRLHPNLSKTADITYFSSVPRPEIIRTKRAENGPIEGITLKKAKSSRDEKKITWAEIEAFISPDLDPEDLEDDEKAEEEREKAKAEFLSESFYVKLNRNDLEDYPAKKIKLFYQYALDGYNVFFVRKTGLQNLKELREFGLLEFSEFINKKLEGYEPSDDYKKYASAYKVKSSDEYWFRVGPSTHLRQLREKLEQEGQYVHPFIAARSEIARLGDYSALVMSGTPQSRLIDRLRSEGMMPYFEGQAWAKTMEIDVSGNFAELRDNFCETYPLLTMIFRHIDITKELNEDLYKYVIAYNTLNNLGEQFENEEKEIEDEVV